MEYTNALVNSSQKVRIRTKLANYTTLYFYSLSLWFFASFTSSSRAESVFTLSGWASATLSFSDGSMERLYSWGCGALPISIFVNTPVLACRWALCISSLLDNGECIVQILLYNIVTSGSIGSQEVVELVAAVGSDACFQRMVQQGGE